MNKLKEILDELLETNLRTKVEIDSILKKYELIIKGKINTLNEIDELKATTIIKDLFIVQNEICVTIYRYSYPTNEFITNFIHDFDRQDDVSIDYLVNKIRKTPNSK